MPGLPLRSWVVRGRLAELMPRMNRNLSPSVDGVLRPQDGGEHQTQFPLPVTIFVLSSTVFPESDDFVRRGRDRNLPLKGQ